MRRRFLFVVNKGELHSNNNLSASDISGSKKSLSLININNDVCSNEKLTSYVSARLALQTTAPTTTNATIPAAATNTTATAAPRTLAANNTITNNSTAAANNSTAGLGVLGIGSQ